MSDFDSQSAPWNAPWNGHDPASNSSARCGTPQTLVSTSTSEIDGLRTLHLLAAASGDGKRGGHDGVMTKGPLSVSPESSITADDTPRPPLRQPWRPFLPPQLGKNTMMPCADGKTVGTRPAAAQAPNWSQNPELVVLERTRMRHGPEHDVSPVGQAVFDWTKELDAVALARAREVTGKYLSGAGSTQGGAVEAAFYRTIPSAAQALWQTHNPDARCISHPRRVHEPPSALPDSPRHLPRHEKPSMAGKAACAPARPASVVRWQEGQWDHDKAEEPAWPRPSSPRRPAPQDGGAVEPGPAYREHKEAAIKEPKLRRACGSGAGQYLKFKPSKDLGGIGLGVRPSRLPVSREHCLGWLPEMLWCLFSVACLAAIAGLLARYNGRPLPAWPLGISLNALVAFLTTLCRAGFVVPVLQGLAQLKWNWFARAERPMGDFQVYEDAQRDPLGSLRLLFSGRGRALGVLGTLILLTGLASSGMTQNIIAYPTGLVPSSGTASVGRSETYSYPEIDLGQDDSLDTRQQQAIQAGLFQRVNDSFPLLAPVCSSGDCVWSTFSSLAVCSRVADVSDRLNVSAQTTDTALGLHLGLGDNTAVYNASLPNGVYLVGGTDSCNLNVSASPQVLGVEDGAQINLAPASATLAFGNQQEYLLTAIADLFVVYTNQTNTTQQPGPGAASNFRAVEILLHFCVNTYTASVSGGVATTKLVDSLTDVIATTVNGTTIVLDKSTTSAAPGSAVLQAVAVPFANDATPTNTVRDTAARGNYTVDGDYLAVLNAYLASAVKGTYSRAYGMGIAGASAAGGALGTAMFNGANQGGTTSGSAEVDVRAVVAGLALNVATSLTNTMRALAPTSAGSTGTVLAAQSYVHARWVWLAFLALQVALAAAFLLGLMVQTAVWRMRVLKGAATPALVAISADGRHLLERAAGVEGVETPAALWKKLAPITARLRVGPGAIGAGTLELGRKGGRGFESGANRFGFGVPF